MKPLRETEGGSPLIERAKALLEAAPPLAESQARMLRVRRALDEPRGLWVRLRRLPAAALAALIVLFGASAFAAVRVFVAVQGAEQESARPAAEPHPGARRSASTTSGGQATTVEDATPAAIPTPIPIPIPTPIPTPIPIPTPTPTVTPAATTSTAVPDQDASHGHARGIRHVRRTTAPTPAHADHDTSPEALAHATDSELVHRAAKALRSDHDPALAARLLEAHRARSPSGPLAEEALSMQVEALHELRSPRTAVLAREYLARYPGGRYTAVATRALADSAP